MSGKVAMFPEGRPLRRMARLIGAAFILIFGSLRVQADSASLRMEALLNGCEADTAFILVLFKNTSVDSISFRMDGYTSREFSLQYTKKKPKAASGTSKSLIEGGGTGGLGPRPPGRTAMSKRYTLEKGEFTGKVISFDLGKLDLVRSPDNRARRTIKAIDLGLSTQVFLVNPNTRALDTLLLSSPVMGSCDQKLLGQ